MVDDEEDLEDDQPEEEIIYKIGDAVWLYYKFFDTLILNYIILQRFEPSLDWRLSSQCCTMTEHITWGIRRETWTSELKAVG